MYVLNICCFAVDDRLTRRLSIAMYFNSPMQSYANIQNQKNNEQ